MSVDRPHPFTLVFGDIAAERFPPLAEAFPAPPTIDQFVMANPVVELMHELRPDSGLGDAIDDFVAFVHAAFRFWSDGQRTRRLDAQATRALLAPGTRARATEPVTTVEYIQVAPRLIWSRLDDAETHEPLDGWFTLPGSGRLRAVACLGVHPNRPGLSVLTAEGPPVDVPRRPDGTAAYAPAMPGGDTAGLASITTPDELLVLAWRAVGEERP